VARVRVLTDQYAPDPATLEHVDSLTKKFQEGALKKVGFTKVNLSLNDSANRYMETNLGNFFTDVVRKDLEVDFCALSGGTFRMKNDIQPGKLILEDMLKIFPFGDTIVTV
jgi:2',3'-cyclic-nucleotide 2'-phosphodiesterase (5'-nucleotidase family)